ncbi:MAG: amidase [Sphingomonadales bacterium]|nr:amidase [Sphingomonadales bacterium]
MKFTDYIEYDATGIAGLIARKEIAAQDACQASLLAVGRLNTILNAVVEVWADEVPPTGNRISSTATSVYTPFQGVPFMVKDLVLQRRSRKIEMGSRLAKGLTAQHNSFLMDIIDSLGFVTLGRTATPELGHSCTTESVANGPTRNPWNLDHSAGGSSGGAGAAVAAGIIPLAHANDGAGSIRIPAACCGLLGLKPSRGRVSAGPDTAEGLFGMGVELAIGRSVRDMAAFLDGAAKPMPGDPFVIMKACDSFQAVIKRPPPRLRIAFTVTPWYEAPISTEIIQETYNAAALCAELGHTVEEASPSFDYHTMRAACIMSWASGIKKWADSLAAASGRQINQDTMEAATLAMYHYGASLTASDLLKAMDGLNAVSRAIGPFFETYDVLITPTTAQPAPQLRTYDQNRAHITHDQWFDHKGKFPPFLAAFNVTGQPAMSVPLGMSKAGLPIGIQFVGKFGREDTLLALAAQLEQSRPWQPQLLRMQRALWEKADQLNVN